MSNHISQPTICYAKAAEVVAVSLRIAEESGVRGVITVCDIAMSMVAFGRADGSTPHSIETSRRKANTAASTRKPSSAMRPDLSLALEHGTGGLLTSISGGVPLKFDGLHLGGLGVAGGTPEQDLEIAIQVLREIGADAI